jgi:hypothetical protein
VVRRGSSVSRGIPLPDGRGSVPAPGESAAFRAARVSKRFDNVKLGCRGEVAEWSIAAVSKTVEPLRVPGVRISPSPPESRLLTRAAPNRPSS